MCDKNKDLKFWDDVSKAFAENKTKDNDMQIWEDEVGSFYTEIEESEKEIHDEQQ